MNCGTRCLGYLFSDGHISSAVSENYLYQFLTHLWRAAALSVHRAQPLATLFRFDSPLSTCYSGCSSYGPLVFTPLRNSPETFRWCPERLGQPAPRGNATAHAHHLWPLFPPVLISFPGPRSFWRSSFIDSVDVLFPSSQVENFEWFPATGTNPLEPSICCDSGFPPCLL